MTRHSSTSPSLRQLRVGEEIRHVISWILERGELQDPELTGRTITVTEVRTSPDLKQATIFVVPLAGRDEQAILSALTRARGFLRHRLGEQARLKFLPNLSFSLDTSFNQADHILGLLRDPRVARDLEMHDTANGEQPGSERDDEGA